MVQNVSDTLYFVELRHYDRDSIPAAACCLHGTPKHAEAATDTYVDWLSPFFNALPSFRPLKAVLCRPHCILPVNVITLSHILQQQQPAGGDGDSPEKPIFNEVETRIEQVKVRQEIYCVPSILTSSYSDNGVNSTLLCSPLLCASSICGCHHRPRPPLNVKNIVLPGISNESMACRFSVTTATQGWYR